MREDDVRQVRHLPPEAADLLQDATAVGVPQRVHQGQPVTTVQQEAANPSALLLTDAVDAVRDLHRDRFWGSSRAASLRESRGSLDRAHTRGRPCGHASAARPWARRGLAGRHGGHRGPRARVKLCGSADARTPGRGATCEQMERRTVGENGTDAEDEARRRLARELHANVVSTLTARLEPMSYGPVRRSWTWLARVVDGGPGWAAVRPPLVGALVLGGLRTTLRL